MKKPNIPWGKYFLMLLPLLVLFAAKPAAAGSDFFAWGNGTATVSGTGYVDLSCHGFIIVSSNAQVVMCGGNAVPVSLPDGRLLYSQFSGTATASGEAFEITCGGSLLWLRGQIQGTVFIKGSGYYKTGFQQGLWRADGITIDITESSAQ